MDTEFTFPADFAWGSATSSHQTEGNNKNCDWWEYENNPKFSSKLKEPSLTACNSYNRYEEDFDLCVKLNTNSIRISIEWARIEPSEGIFDETEITHYRKVLEAAKARKLKTFVTLHHFTNPIWFIHLGGWLSPKSVEYFERYAKKCAETLHDLIDVFLTINEPQVYMYQSFVIGEWPPFKTNYKSALKVRANMIKANNKAYTIIKTICSKPVGIVENISWIQPAKGFYLVKPLDALLAKVIYFANAGFFLNPIKNYTDFIGLNHYTTVIIDKLRVIKTFEPSGETGWWINPVGIKYVLLNLKKYNLPIYITENGLACSKREDNLRIKYINDILSCTAEAINQEVDVKGYFHWSLLDNFEWHSGYSAKFGLIEIDRNDNLTRIPRASFFAYGRICKDGKICLSS